MDDVKAGNAEVGCSSTNCVLGGVLVEGDELVFCGLDDGLVNGDLLGLEDGLPEGDPLGLGDGLVEGSKLGSEDGETGLRLINTRMVG